MPQPIPQPPGLPVLGNVLDIKPSNTWASLQRLAEQYGEIFQIKVLGRTIVFVASVALAEEICDEKRFRKFVGGPVVEIRAMVHDSLFAAYDNEASWGIAHRIIAPTLQPPAVAALFDQMRDLTSELLQLWKEGGGARQPICPFRDLARLDLEMVTLTFFGQRLNGLTGPEHPCLQAMENSTAEAVMRPTRPRLVNWLLYRRKFQSAIDAMRAYAADVVKHRRAHPTERRDLLATLMTATDPETGTALTESQVLDEIMTMPIGSSTTPCMLATAILLLLQNPAAVATAREELDRVVGAGPLAHAHLAQLAYIEGIQREALRLSSAAPGFNIEPLPSQDQRPVLLAGGKYQVAHNQPIIIVMHGVNRDPAVFEDPLAFRPERMVGEAFASLPAGAKKWFGNGKRECVGKHYAWQAQMVALAMMLRELDFDMADPEYKLHQDGWFNIRPVDFNVKVKARAEAAS